MEALLKIEGLHSGYGPIKALRGIDLDVRKGEVMALIGSNGAGKTTLLMSICGIVKPSQGRVRYQDQDITNAPSYSIINKGIAQVPEGRRIFSGMSVLENLQMGAEKQSRQHYSQDLEWVFSLFPVLQERMHQRGGTLSGGEQQMLAIARALMSRPNLMLMDEPSLGLAPLIVKQIFKIIEEINQRGTTILLVEQNAYAALRLAHRACVLATGQLVLSGEAKTLLEHPEVQKAYLGGH
ncbi:MAG: ABC transporter ATP-binding protein [Deltaproteobacteria bacterium]|nr:ABC transporter ATP-binding protein [Deltaproteobacteria bacterium]